MAPTSRAQLIDRVLGGRLSEQMQAWRTAGLTYDEIAQAFRTDHDIKVSREWVRRWFDGEFEAKAS